MDEDVAHILAQGRRFTPLDVEKIERLCNIMGRCHDMVNKVESLFGMRNDIREIDNVTSAILGQIDSSKQHFSNISSHFKKF